MIIKELNIVGFGKHKDKVIELSEGINVIYGENESGKSTVCAFIHAMLYGVEKRRGKPAVDSIYNKYQAVGETWSGSMRFEYKGKEYEIFRTFPDGKEPTVIDCTTGAKVDFSMCQEAFGEESAFDSTLYISQDKNDDSGKLLENIKTYTRRITTGKDEKTDVNGAIKHLKARAKTLEEEKNGIKGRLEKLLVVKEEIKGALEEYDMQGQILCQLKEEAGKKDVQKEEKVKSIEKYIEEYPAMQLEYEKFCQGRKQVELIIEMEEAKKDDRYLLNKKAKGLYYFLLMIGLFAGLGICAFLPVSMPVKCIVFVAIVLALGLVNFMWDSVIIRKLAEMFIKNEVNAAYEESERCKEIIEDMEEQKARLEEYGKGSVASFTVDEMGMEQLRLGIEQLKQRVTEYYNVQKAKEDKLSKDINKQEWLLDSISSKIGARNYEELEAECEECRRLMGQLEKKLKATEKAQELIKEISEEFGGNFKEDILNDFSAKTKTFTLGMYERVLLDEQMRIKVLCKGDFVDISKLSYGTVKQIYLALRLAVAKWLGQEELPLIIDDGFAFYDDERLKEGLMGINNENIGQTIIFTCQKREGRILEEMGVNYNEVAI